MAQCSTCWYGQGFDTGGRRTCRQRAPGPEDIRGDNAWWPPVQDTDWCGAHAVGDPIIYGSTPSRIVGTGSFTATAGATTNVADVRIMVDSLVIMQSTSSTTKQFYVSAKTAGVGFVVSCPSGAAGTETFDYIATDLSQLWL